MLQTDRPVGLGAQSAFTNHEFGIRSFGVGIEVLKGISRKQGYLAARLLQATTDPGGIL